MKRQIAFLLAALCLVFAASCGRSAANEPTDTVSVSVRPGAWKNADSPVLTPQMRQLTEKAFTAFSGAEYTAAAYLARQKTVGTNHRFLCMTNSVLPDGAETYSVAELHEDPDGSVRITDIVDSVVQTDRDAMPESPEIGNDIRAALDGAAKPDGVDYVPIACLARRISEKMYVTLLCTSSAKAPDDDTAYIFVELAVASDGTGEIADAVEFTAGSDNASR